jgi:hypothetical protein
MIKVWDATPRLALRREKELNAMRSLPKDMLVLAVAAAALIYLTNPTLGIFEFLPDNLPIIGNIDEAGATMLLVGALRYFGFDLTSLFRGRKEEPEVIVQDRRDTRS